MAGITSFGTLLQMDSEDNDGTWATIADLGDIDGPELAAAMEDVTTHTSTSGWEESQPDGVLGVGEISFEVNYNPVEGTHDDTTGLISVWRTKHKRNFRLVFPTSPDLLGWLFSAYVTKFSPKAPVRGVLKADVSIKPTGVVEYDQVITLD